MRRVIGALLGIGLGLVPVPVSAQIARHTVAVTTDAAGDATVYTTGTSGRVVAIRYVPDATSPLDTAASLTITDNGSGLQILAVSNLGVSARDFAPRMFTMTTTGAIALYAAAGESVLAPVPVSGAIKVVVAAGGNAKLGTIYVFVDGS